MQLIPRPSHLPHSPRKVQLIAASLPGRKVTDALTSLKFNPKHAGAYVVKVIKQAVANAKNNFKLDQNTLVIKEIYATKGRTWKKVRFAGRGRRRMYEKTTSHLTIKLESVEPVSPKPPKSPKSHKLLKSPKKLTTKTKNGPKS